MVKFDTELLKDGQDKIGQYIHCGGAVSWMFFRRWKWERRSEFKFCFLFFCINILLKGVNPSLFFISSMWNWILKDLGRNFIHWKWSGRQSSYLCCNRCVYLDKNIFWRRHDSFLSQLALLPVFGRENTEVKTLWLICASHKI